MKYLLILILFFSACSTQKKCNRYINQLTKLGCLKSDTITKYDTIKGFQVDTFTKFSDSSFSDTIVIEKNGVKSETIIKWKTKEVSQTINQKDTIIETKSINKYLIKSEKYIPNYLRVALISLSLLLLFFMGLAIFRK
jgi:hypothetical protein